MQISPALLLWNAMRRTALSWTAALALTAAPAAASDLSIGTTATHSRGRYGGSEPTEISVASGSLSASIDEWELTATVPYLQVEIGMGDELSLGGVLIRSQEREKISGFGDLVVTAGRTLPLADLPFDLAIEGQLKLPTGRSSLSSGRVDAGLEVQVSRPFGPSEPYLMLGRRFYGDPPGLDLKDSWAGSAGITFTHGRLTWIASYDWEQSALGLPDAHDIFLIGSAPLGPDWTVLLLASKGLSDGSADIMFGFGVTRLLDAGSASPRPRSSSLPRP